MVGQAVSTAVVRVLRHSESNGCIPLWSPEQSRCSAPDSGHVLGVDHLSPVPYCQHEASWVTLPLRHLLLLPTRSNPRAAWSLSSTPGGVGRLPSGFGVHFFKAKIRTNRVPRGCQESFPQPKCYKSSISSLVKLFLLWLLLWYPKSIEPFGKPSILHQGWKWCCNAYGRLSQRPPPGEHPPSQKSWPNYYVKLIFLLCLFSKHRLGWN